MTHSKLNLTVLSNVYYKIKLIKLYPKHYLNGYKYKTKFFDLISWFQEFERFENNDATLYARKTYN